MTSSGGGDGGDHLSAAPRALLHDLMEVRDRAADLQIMLQGSPASPSTTLDAAKLMDGMMTRLSSALWALGTSDGGGSGVAPSSGGGPGSSGRRKRGTAAGPYRRSGTRGRSRSPFCKTVTATTLDDGKQWRKYGHKQIQDSTKPRSYYRCSHKPEQGCMATRHVQDSESNPSEFVIHYYGEHTCRDPSKFPLVVEASAPADECTNLISFASKTTSASTFPHGFVKEAIDPTLFSCFSRYSSPQAQECVGSEGALSTNLSPVSSPVQAGKFFAAAGRMSASTVGSAPAEYWPAEGGAGDIAGAGMESFPSSPSSLGFMTGSFGSFGDAGDDDLFGFDP